MTDEPYRYVEAMANRREYVENQLATGSPIVALSYDGGVLFLTVGPERQKVFEIYDRIALGALGHPGDIERLRMIAIEVASTEGFTRSPVDVSLRRLTSYSFSPMLKNAFEQVYGPPFLARLLFAELGRKHEPDLFVRLDFDGSQQTSGVGVAREPFGVLAGTQRAMSEMHDFLKTKDVSGPKLSTALDLAAQAWGVGTFYTRGQDHREKPTDESISHVLKEALKTNVLEAAVLECGAPEHHAYRPLDSSDVEALTARYRGSD